MFARLGAAARSCSRPVPTTAPPRFADRAILRICAKTLPQCRHQSTSPPEAAVPAAVPTTGGSPPAPGTGSPAGTSAPGGGRTFSDWFVDNGKLVFGGLISLVVLWVVRSNMADSREDMIVRALEAQSPLSSKEINAICRLNRLPTQVFAAAAAELLKAHAESGGKPVPLADALAVLRQFAQLQGFADALSDELLVQAGAAGDADDAAATAPSQKAQKSSDPLRESLLQVALQLQPVPSVPLGAPRAPDSPEPQAAAPEPCVPGSISRERLAAAVDAVLARALTADVLPLCAVPPAAGNASVLTAGKGKQSSTGTGAKGAAGQTAQAPELLLRPAPPFVGTFALQRAAAIHAAVYSVADAAGEHAHADAAAASHLPHWHPLSMVHSAEMRCQRRAAAAAAVAGSAAGSAVSAVGSAAAAAGEDTFDELSEGPAEPRRGGEWLHDSKLEHALAPTRYITESAPASSMYRPACPLPASEALAAVGGALSSSSSDAGPLRLVGAISSEPAGRSSASAPAAAASGAGAASGTGAAAEASGHAASTTAAVHPLLLLSIAGLLMGSAPELPIAKPPETPEAQAAAAAAPAKPPPPAPLRTLRSPHPTASQRIALYVSMLLGHRDLLAAAASASGPASGKGPGADAGAGSGAADLAATLAAALAAAPANGGLALPVPIADPEPAACAAGKPAPLPVPLPPHLALVPAPVRERRYTAAEVCDLIDLLAATQQLPPRMRVYRPEGEWRQWPLPRWQLKPSPVHLREALEETGLLKDKVTPVTLLEGGAAARPPAPAPGSPARRLPWRTWHAGGDDAEGGPHVPPGHASAGGAADPLLAARAATGLGNCITESIPAEDALLPALSRDLSFEEVRRILVSRAVCAWGECLFIDDYRAGTRTSNRWLQY